MQLGGNDGSGFLHFLGLVVSLGPRCEDSECTRSARDGGLFKTT